MYTHHHLYMGSKNKLVNIVKKEPDSEKQRTVIASREREGERESPGMGSKRSKPPCIE